MLTTIHSGAIVHCRVFDGSIKPGDTIQMMSTGRTFKVEEVGAFRVVRSLAKS